MPDSTHLHYLCCLSLSILTNSFSRFKEFVLQHQFVKQANQSFLHLNAHLKVFFVESGKNTKNASKNLQKQVLELRKNGFQVFVVREENWLNKELLIREIIRYKLQKLIAVFARDLKVSKISASDAKDFLKKNHLLGLVKSRTYIALYIPEHRKFRFEKFGFSGIVAVAVFGKNMLRKKEGFEGTKSVEWARFVTLPEIRIVGGITKVFDYLNEMDPFDDVMTYVDIENNDSKGLQNIGFTLEEITEPIQLNDGYNLGNYKLRYVRS